MLTRIIIKNEIDYGEREPYGQHYNYSLHPKVLQRADKKFADTLDHYNKKVN